MHAFAGDLRAEDALNDARSRLTVIVAVAWVVTAETDADRRAASIGASTAKPWIQMVGRMRDETEARTAQNRA